MTYRNRFRLIALLLILLPLAAAGCDAFVTRPHLALQRLIGDLPESSEFGSPEFEAAIDRASRSHLRDGNRVNLLRNGDQVFPAMLADIRAARREIMICTYIYSSKNDFFGMALANLLAKKAREGVKVMFVYDAFGSLDPRGQPGLKIMDRAGVQIRPFNPFYSWTLLRFNNRCHAKILVVDGRIGYTMGLNLRDKYGGTGKEYGKWRDTGVRFKGPAAIDLRSAFLQIWGDSGAGFGRHRIPLPFVDLVKDEITDAIAGAAPWPPPEKLPDDCERFDDGVPARVLLTGPGWFSHELYGVFLKAIVSAKQSIDITYGYFLPDQPLTKALLEAAARGVKIRIILPDRLDFYLTKKTSLECASKLWRRGIKMYAYRSALLHSKTMVIDGIWSTVGSANMNGRSMFLNYECNLSVIDRKFAASLTQAFEEDLMECKKLELRDLRPRNPLQYIVNKTLFFFKDQL